MKRKFGKRRGRGYADFLSILLVITVIAILSLVGYLTYKVINEKTVEANASASNDEFLSIAEENEKMLKKEIQDQEQESDNSSEEIDYDLLNKVIEENKNETMAKEEEKTPKTSTVNKNNIKKAYMGNYEIKGSINIPKTKCKYPILEKVTPDSLKKSVAILDIVPSSQLQLEGKVDDLNVQGTNAFILGHNYLNGQFFSNNDKLSIGDTIQITDIYNTTITYTIYSMFYVLPDDVSFMERDVDINTREITLQTCNENSSKRLIILAKDN